MSALQYDEPSGMYYFPRKEVNMGYPAFSSPAPAQARVTLELNGDEAQTLADILSAVEDTRGTCSDDALSVYKTLESIGYAFGDADDMHGQIGFD